MNGFEKKLGNLFHKAIEDIEDSYKAMDLLSEYEDLLIEYDKEENDWCSDLCCYAFDDEKDDDEYENSN